MEKCLSGYSISGSTRGHMFNSQHSRGSWQLSVTPVPEDSAWVLSMQSSSWEYTQRKIMHIKWNSLKREIKSYQQIKIEVSYGKKR